MEFEIRESEISDLEISKSSGPDRHLVEYPPQETLSGQHN